MVLGLEADGILGTHYATKRNCRHRKTPHTTNPGSIQNNICVETNLTTKLNPMFKRCIANFKVSSHQLAIETGRHQK